MSKYQFDAARWCESMKLAHFRNKDYTTAENFKQTKMELERLQSELAALKDAARPVAKLIVAQRESHGRETWAGYAWNIGTAVVTSQEMDELARLCGEE